MENELNEIALGNDKDFKQEIKDVDEKLANLLKEFNVGVDGGDKTLIEIINNVFEDVKNTETLSGQIENELEAADKNHNAINDNLYDTQETIQEIQKEINRLLNETTVEGPEALQDAFDRSEKFEMNSGQLKNILDEAKLILKDYEENLKNAKLLTEKAIKKLAEVDQEASETLATQEEVEEKLDGVGDLKTSEIELNNLQKLSREALQEANRVFDEAFDLLNEVTKFELVAKLEDINEKVEKLKNHSGETDKTLKEFAKENENFLDEIEKTVETAEKAEEKAFKLKEEVEALLEILKSIHKDALQSIADVEAVIDNGTKIYKSLEDFTMMVEKSRESARIALEKLPEVIKKIADTLKIVEKLEEKMDKKTKVAFDKKEKFTKAKKLTDEVLEETENVEKRLEKFEIDFENQPNELLANDKEQTKISDDIDKLEKLAEEDAKLTETTKEKVETASSKMLRTDEEVEKALKKLQQLIEELDKVEEIDEQSFYDLGKRDQRMTAFFTEFSIAHFQFHCQLYKQTKSCHPLRINSSIPLTTKY